MRRLKIYLCFILLVLAGSGMAYAQSRTYIRLRCNSANESYLVINNNGTIGTIPKTSASADCNTHCNWANVASGNGYHIYQIINGQDIYLKANADGVSLTAEASEATVFYHENSYGPIGFDANSYRYYLRYTDHLFVDHNEMWNTPVVAAPLSNEGVTINTSNFEGVTIDNFPLTSRFKYVIQNEAGTSYININGNTVSTFNPDNCIWESGTELTDGGTIDNAARTALSLGQGVNTTGYRTWEVTESASPAGNDRIILGIDIPSGNNNLFAGDSKELIVTKEGLKKPAATNYRFADADHFVTSNGIYLGSSQTILYDNPLVQVNWSKTGDSQNNTSLTGTSKDGATLNYNSDCGEQKTITVTVTATSSAFSNEYSASAQLTLRTLASVNSGNYVIYNSGKYLKNDNGQLVTATAFDPATCIWAASGSNGNLTFSNGGKYLTTNEGSVSLSTTSATWTVSSTEGGTMKLGDNYLRLAGSTWALSADVGTACAYKVTTTQQNTALQTAPTISGSDNIEETGSSSYTHTNASYIPPYTLYQFAGTNHYFSEQAGLTDSQQQPQSLAFTYTWKLSNNAAGHMTVNNMGQLSYTTPFDDNTDVTLTLTATSSQKTFTVDKTISVFVSLSDIYCFIRNASRQDGEGETRNYDFYLTPSSNTYNNNNNLHFLKQDPAHDANQLWLIKKYDNKYFQIIHVQDGRYIVTKNGTTTDNTNNRNYQCVYLAHSSEIENFDNSLFLIGKYNNTDSYYIRPKCVENSDLSFNPMGWGTMDLQIYTQNDLGSRWYIDRQNYTPVNEGYWHIRNSNNNDYYLNIVSGNVRAVQAANPSAISANGCWEIRRSGNVYYQIISATGEYLTYQNNAFSLNAAPQDADNALFRIGSSDSEYYIMPKKANNNTVSLSSANGINNNVISSDWGNSKLSRWTFVAPVGALAGSYVISDANGYLANVNGSLTKVQTFNPNTCVWTAEGSAGQLTLSNGGKYLYNNGGTAQLSNNATTWNINTSANGTISNSGLTITEKADRITSIETGGVGTEPTITGGASTISELGTLNFGHTEASFANVDCYVFKGQNHYVSPDGNTYYGSEMPESETFTYEWSVYIDAVGYMTIDENGLLSYDNQFEEPTTTKIILIAKSASETYTVYRDIEVKVAGFCAPGNQQYVIYSKDRFLANNDGTFTTYEVFQPERAIWRATSTTFNGTNCLIFTNNYRNLNINGNEYWVVSSDGGGSLQSVTTGKFLYVDPVDHNWKVGDNPDGAAYAILNMESVQEKTQNPLVGTEETYFDELRSYKFYCTQEATDIKAYRKYTLKNGPELYISADGEQYHYYGTSAPESIHFTYSWSIDNNSGFVSIDQSGNLTYNRGFNEPTRVTITLSAKKATDNKVVSANITVDFLPASSNFAQAQYDDRYCFIVNHSTLGINNEEGTYYLIPSTDNYRLITAKVDENDKSNAVWILRKYSNDTYQLIHESKGRYIIANGTTEMANAIHLEQDDRDLAGSLFTIGELVIDQYGYFIRPAASNPNEMGLSFNPYGGNGNNIGLYPCKRWNQGINMYEKVSGSMWFIQDAKVTTPSIMADNGKISISCPTKGADIHYTTDGSTPTEASPLYTQPFDYQNGETIKAIAIAHGYFNSDVASQSITAITSLSQIPADGANGYYILTCDIENPTDFTSIQNFNGIFDGSYHTISGLQQPLFYNTVDALVKNVRLDNVNIEGTGNLGAIACLGKGRSIFLNCGVLASNSSTISGGTNVGSIVGQIEDKTRVVNCYSYATLQGTTVGGIVGSNSGTASVIEDIHTMIMNCIFYGDLDDSSTRVSPVYGGTNISNRNNINTYTFYQAFDENGQLKYNSTATNNAMPVTDNSYLDRFEFYRTMLNSHRELSAYYAFNDNKRKDQVGKWILDTRIAPYPIIDYWTTNTRRTLDREIPNTTDDFAGRQIGTVEATFVIKGSNGNIRDQFTMPITDMDTANWDYTYGKIMLPFANEITQSHRDWRPMEITNDDFKSMIITGWEVTSITGGTVGEITEDYNYSDPLSTAKDLFNVSDSTPSPRAPTFNPFVYAQGGNFVVPTGVTAITFTAHWAPCVYLADAGEDVSYNPEFTESTQIGNYSWENRTEAIVSSSFRDNSYQDHWHVWANPETSGYPDGQGERWDSKSDFLEFYRGDDLQRYGNAYEFEIDQTVNLEPGTYMLRFYGFSRHRDYAYEGIPKTHDNMYGSRVHMFTRLKNGTVLKEDTLKSVYDHTAQEMNAVMDGYDGFNPNAANNMDGFIHSIQAAKVAFDHGYFLNELVFEVPEAPNNAQTEVEIHIKSDRMPRTSWCTFRDMKLYKLIDETYTDMSFQDKKVIHNVTDALEHLSVNEIPNNQAIVLVGNYHLNDRIIGNSFANNENDLSLEKAITFMSVDDDLDQEPDYCMYMYTSNPEGISRTDTPPLRFDFLTCPGIGMAARVSGSSAVPGIGIWHTRGWYETTETYLGIHSEAEINPSYKKDGWISPWIINGGLYSQIIMNYDGARNLNTNNNAYIRLGGKALIKQFHPGNNDNVNFTTYLLPVNVNGGEIEECYMTGREGTTDTPITEGNVRFWSNSGYIHEFLGAYMAPVNGNVTAKMDHTLIDNFYGGGMNANQPVSGNIDITANNCWIDYYVGGPKVGDMWPSTSVTTHANGTLFGNYFGGGYGGTSIARKTVWNETVGVEVSISSDLEFPVAFTNYTGRRLKYEAGYGIATGYGFEYFFEAGGQGNLISRFFVDYSSLSLATVREVSNTLDSCTILNDFYGGGRQGYVDGNITSTLTDCTVKGSAFAGGYTGRYKETPVSTTEKPEYSTYLFGMGVFTPFGTVEPETYHWEQAEDFDRVYNSNTKSLFTTDDMSLMGKVNGTTSLTIGGASTIEGSVFGGGNQADVNGSTNVSIISDDTYVTGTVFGGGNESNVTAEDTAEGNTTVTITGGIIGGDVFGGGNQGNVSGDPHVIIGQ